HVPAGGQLLRDGAVSSASRIARILEGPPPQVDRSAPAAWCSAARVSAFRTCLQGAEGRGYPIGRSARAGRCVGLQAAASDLERRLRAHGTLDEADRVAAA